MFDRPGGQGHNFQNECQDFSHCQILTPKTTKQVDRFPRPISTAPILLFERQLISIVEQLYESIVIAGDETSTNFKPAAAPSTYVPRVELAESLADLVPGVGDTVEPMRSSVRCRMHWSERTD